MAEVGPCSLGGHVQAEVYRERLVARERRTEHRVLRRQETMGG